MRFGDSASDELDSADVSTFLAEDLDAVEALDLGPFLVAAFYFGEDTLLTVELVGFFDLSDFLGLLVTDFLFVFTSLDFIEATFFTFFLEFTDGLALMGTDLATFLAFEDTALGFFLTAPIFKAASNIF